VTDAPHRATTWPHDRSTRAAVMAQFGESQADLIGWALVTADPLADAVVSEIHSDRPGVNRSLIAGIRHGLASLQHPPDAVAALLADAERRPGFVTDELIARGSAAYYTTPGAVHLMSLAGGSLVRVYESPSISAVLAATGRLIDGAEQRILETGTWLATVMLPGALAVGQPGYVATLQVRMLHAHMRRFVRERHYDEAAYGAPINQTDLVRTWMDFTLTSYRAEDQMGYGLTEAELAELYTYWQLVADLLGIDSRLVQGIADHEAAQRLDDLLQAVTGPPLAESVTLAAATIETAVDLIHQFVSIPTELARPGVRALTRRFHGDRVADALQIPTSAAADAVLTPAIDLIRTRRAHLRRDPVAWAEAMGKNLDEARLRLAPSPDREGTQYERTT
jgi:hypothetical protein